MADESSSKEERKPSRQARKCAEIGRILVKEEIKARFKQVEKALKKETCDRSPEDLFLLDHSQDIVDEIEKRAKKRDIKKQRILEIEDSAEEVDKKCEILAKVIEKAKNLIVYTGAGISTAASIPDYRGPNGVWTLLQQGKNVAPQDLSDAIPTLTHMSLTQLHNKGYVKYVVSQNCDGLHLRSGLPCYALSEVHGNMYIEHCTKCKPAREYIRIFDVTERTALYRHKTERFCHKCESELTDTIIHFGEKSRPDSVYQWPTAADWVEKADMVLCLGSSLKVLKKYSHLWSMDLPPTKRPNIYIVNLQWTPKDEVAALKINGQCDIVMEKVMKILGLTIPTYIEEVDPIFYLHKPLKAEEEDTVQKKILKVPEKLAPPKWVYLKNQRSKRHQKHKNRKRKRKGEPDDNPPTKAAKIKKEDLESINVEDVESTVQSLPSPDHTYASNSPRSSGYSRSSSPRSVSYSRSISPRSLAYPQSPRSVSNPVSISPKSVIDLPSNTATPNHTEPNSPKSEGGQSTLSNLIDEVVTKFADDDESPNLDAYLHQRDEKLGSSGDEGLHYLPQPLNVQKKEETFQTTRWLLNQPPLFNFYPQGFGAGFHGGRHPALIPGQMYGARGFRPANAHGLFPSFPPQRQMIRMMQMHPGTYSAPSSTASGPIQQKPGAPQFPATSVTDSKIGSPMKSMHLPLFIQTSQSSAIQVSSAIQAPSSSNVKTDAKPKIPTSYATILPPEGLHQVRTSSSVAPAISAGSTQGNSSLIVSTSTSSNQEPAPMASKYPILSGFIKIAEEEATSQDSPNVRVKHEPKTFAQGSAMVTGPNGSHSNLSSLIDEVVNKFADENEDSPRENQPMADAEQMPPVQPVSEPEGHLSNKVRQRLFHHIKRRSSQNLFSSGESPMPSPDPNSPNVMATSAPNHGQFIYPPSTLGYQAPPGGIVAGMQLPTVSQGDTQNRISVIPYAPTSNVPVMAQQVIPQPTIQTMYGQSAPILVSRLDNIQGVPPHLRSEPINTHALPSSALQQLERQVQQMEETIPEGSKETVVASAESKMPVLPNPQQLLMFMRQSFPGQVAGNLSQMMSEGANLPVAVVPMSVAAQPVSSLSHTMSTAFTPALSPSKVLRADAQPAAATHPTSSTAQPVPASIGHVPGQSHPMLAAALGRQFPLYYMEPARRSSVSETLAQALVPAVSEPVQSGASSNTRSALPGEPPPNIEQREGDLVEIVKQKIQQSLGHLEKFKQDKEEGGMSTCEDVLRSEKYDTGVSGSHSDPVVTSSGSSLTGLETTKGSSRQPLCTLTQLADYVVSDQFKKRNESVSSPKSSTSSYPSHASHSGENSSTNVDKCESIDNLPVTVVNLRDNEPQQNISSNPSFSQCQSKAKESDTTADVFPSTNDNMPCSSTANVEMTFSQTDDSMNVKSGTTCVSLVVRPAERCRSSSNSSGKKTPVYLDESSKSSTGSEDNKPPKRVEVSSVPGWFGKGLKKYKKKR